MSKHTSPSAHAVQITALPALDSNYIWLLHDDYHAVVVDPGDAAVVQAALRRHRLTLAAILLTHHHHDHIGGVPALCAHSPQLPVYGPADEPRMPGINRPLGDGDTFSLFDGRLEFRVLTVPGHTRSHIAYYAAGTPGLLFCGDTLFSAGCGRIFEGTAAQLHASLQRLAALPDDTEVYCTHEYTLANLRFAAAVEPDNPARDRYRAGVEALRAADQPSLPARLGVERSINPFLRTDEPQIRATVAAHAGHALADGLACFTALRAWKDVFQG